jgi:hypothetical protein
MTLQNNLDFVRAFHRLLLNEMLDSSEPNYEQEGNKVGGYKPLDLKDVYQTIEVSPKKISSDLVTESKFLTRFGAENVKSTIQSVNHDARTMS